MNTYGYARVSTKKQSIDRQIDNIKSICAEAIIYQEEFTGTKIERPEFKKLLKRVKPGDTIIFDEVSRMSRNAEEGFAVYQELFDKGINLVFVKEPHINTDTYKKALDTSVSYNGGKAVEYLIEGVNRCLKELAREQISLAFDRAEQEILFLHKRTSEGVRKAKERYIREELEGKEHEKLLPGNQLGGKRETAKAKQCKETILKHSKSFGGTLNDTELQAMLDISRNSLYKYKRELKQ